MGMSGVQVLGRDRGDVTEGRTTLRAASGAARGNDDGPPPRTPACPCQLPMDDHCWVIEASQGQSIGFERADELHAVQCLVGGDIPTVWIKIVVL